MPSGKHSTKGIGKTCPNAAEAVKLPDDVIIPVGNGVTDEKLKSDLLYNEYIVYNNAQIKCRYLVKVKLAKPQTIETNYECGSVEGEELTTPLEAVIEDENRSAVLEQKLINFFATASEIVIPQTSIIQFLNNENPSPYTQDEIQLIFDKFVDRNAIMVTGEEVYLI